jgi:hypothetical protein
MIREARLLPFVCSVGIALLGASPAFATFSYSGDPFVSPNYTFNNVQETTDIVTYSGDPEPLFGDDGANAPTTVGDSLLFDPLAAFSATSINGTGPDGGGTFDGTHSTLNLEITANAIGTPIDTITITETGTMSIVGAGAFGTGSWATLGGGNVKVTHQGGVAILAVDIPIPVDDFFLFNVDTNGNVAWQLTSVIDVNSVVPGATRVEIALNNQLEAYSDGPGYSATLSKDSLSISLPEPTTVSLMALGLLGAVFCGRRSRE